LLDNGPTYECGNRCRKNTWRYEVVSCCLQPDFKPFAASFQHEEVIVLNGI
jgi:hypothetical protein